MQAPVLLSPLGTKESVSVMVNGILGCLPITPENLSQKLEAAASKLARKYDRREMYTAWTRAIKETLASIAEECSCEAQYSDKRKQLSEYMVDVVWWSKTSNGWGAMIAIESEWGNQRDHGAGRIDNVVKAVDYDFCKLLCFKAPLKVLIFTSEKSTELRRAICKQTCESIRTYRHHIKGEIYLLLDFARDAFYRYVYEVKTNGKVDHPKLVPVDEHSKRALEESDIMRKPRKRVTQKRGVVRKATLLNSGAVG